MGKFYRLTVTNPDTDQEAVVLFSWRPPSGDGWNEPRDEGGPEFEGVLNPDGSIAYSATWEWAETAFAHRLADAAQIVTDDDDAQREIAADLRREDV